MGNFCIPKYQPIQCLLEPPSKAELLLFQNAKIYEKTQDLQKAVLQYEKIIYSNPYSAKAYLALGRTLLNMGDLTNSIQNFQKSIDLCPSNKHAYNGLGVVFQLAGNDKDSIIYFKRAIQIDPNFSYPYNGLGNLYYGRQKYLEAIPFYEKSHELDPNNSLILLNLASSQIQVGSFLEAAQNINEIEKRMIGEKMVGTNKFFYDSRVKQLKQAILKRKNKRQRENI